jgi:hypothetical protein
MRSLLIRGGLVLAAILIVGISWLVLARQLSELVDAVWTVHVASLSPSPFTWNGTWLQFGPPIGDVEKNFVGDLPGIDPQFRSLSLTGPGPNYGNAADIAVDADGKLVLTAGSKRFVLGTPTGNMIPIQAFRDMPEFAADPGDTVSLVIEHSLLSWPAPFELNVVGFGGSEKTWIRHVYYRLSWVKASGTRLSMLWAGDQPFYGGGDDSWGAPGGFLTQVEIR